MGGAGFASGAERPPPSAVASGIADYHPHSHTHLLLCPIPCVAHTLAILLLINSTVTMDPHPSGLWQRALATHQLPSYWHRESGCRTMLQLHKLGWSSVAVQFVLPFPPANRMTMSSTLRMIAIMKGVHIFQLFTCNRTRRLPATRNGWQQQAQATRVTYVTWRLNCCSQVAEDCIEASTRPQSMHLGRHQQ